MKIVCEIEETDLEGENGRAIPGVIVRCAECDHEVESFGTSERSIRRCLALLRESCPSNEENFYVTEED